MKKYGNLSKFSNQGWEALNAMIKTYFFRGTNKGGGGGKGMRKKSKLVAIGKWMQRRLMWLCEDSCTLFPEVENNINNSIEDNNDYFNEEDNNDEEFDAEEDYNIFEAGNLEFI